MVVQKDRNVLDKKVLRIFHYFNKLKSIRIIFSYFFNFVKRTFNHLLILKALKYFQIWHF